MVETIVTKLQAVLEFGRLFKYIACKQFGFDIKLAFFIDSMDAGTGEETKGVISTFFKGKTAPL